MAQTKFVKSTLDSPKAMAKHHNPDKVAKKPQLYETGKRVWKSQSEPPSSSKTYNDLAQEKKAINSILDRPAGLMSSSRLDPLLRRYLGLLTASQRTLETETSNAIYLSWKARQIQPFLVDHEIRRREIELLAKNRGQRHRPNGLRNPQYSCFRRSVLQAILHIPRVLSWLARVYQRHLEAKLHENKRGRPIRFCLACSLHLLAEELWRRPPTTELHTALSRVDDAVDARAPESCDWVRKNRHRRQACAHDYLVKVVENLTETLGPNETDCIIIPGLFQLLMEPTWQCEHCGQHHRSSTNDETGLNLAIPLDVETTLEALLTQCFEEQMTIRCENCPETYHVCKEAKPCKRLKNCTHETELRQFTGRNTERNRTVKIRAAPEILFIHLRRITAIEGTARQVIRRNRVEYPVYLDMGKYFIDPSRNGTGYLRYRLSSVIAHSGTSVNTGHYVTYAEAGNNRVHRLDDEEVSSVKASEMLNPSDGFLPYILVYVYSPQSTTLSSTTAE